MNNIRAIVLSSLVGVSSLMGVTQPAYAQKIFVEQVDVAPKDTTPAPEITQVLPLIFPDNTKADSGLTEQMNTELFAPLFVDNSNGVIKKSVSTEKVMPIETDAMKGISTYFSRFHPGVDFRANVGTPIHAILPGTVNEVSFEKGGYGRYIVLVHHVDGKTLFSLYAHMRATKVAEGDSVNAGDVIGEVGLTGHTTGPHVHFELHDTLSAMDPLKFFANKTLAMIVTK